MTPPHAPSIVRWCVNEACARCRAALLYLPPNHPADCPSCGRPAELVPTDGPGCPNPFCAYEADTAALGYCPSCCLSFPEAWAMRGAGAATPCYCGDTRDEHARGVGACLMVRDGVRCGCGRFENPATAGSSVPVHLLPMTTVGPAWEWPDDDRAPEPVAPWEGGYIGAVTAPPERCPHGQYGWCIECDGDPRDEPEPLPGPDPDLADVTLDDVVSELRDALGTHLPRPDGGTYPGHLEDIADTLGRIETLLVCSRPSFLLTAGRCLVVFVTVACLMLLGWLIVGASTLAGVVP